MKAEAKELGVEFNPQIGYDKLKKRIDALSFDGEPNLEEAKPLIDKFKEALDNDLNTSLGLTCVYDVLKADVSDATKLYSIGEFDKVLSLNLIDSGNNTENASESNAEIDELIAKRTKARAEKDWATADAIRDKLKEMHVVIEDTKDGIKWHFE